jgi:hypothetical protein
MTNNNWKQGECRSAVKGAVAYSVIDTIEGTASFTVKSFEKAKARAGRENARHGVNCCYVSPVGGEKYPSKIDPKSGLLITSATEETGWFIPAEREAAQIAEDR